VVIAFPIFGSCRLLALLGGVVLGMLVSSVVTASERGHGSPRRTDRKSARTATSIGRRPRVGCERPGHRRVTWVQPGAGRLRALPRDDDRSTVSVGSLRAHGDEAQNVVGEGEEVGGAAPAEARMRVPSWATRPAAQRRRVPRGGVEIDEAVFHEPRQELGHEPAEDATVVAAAVVEAVIGDRDAAHSQPWRGGA
jgi:hypothetical protein